MDINVLSAFRAHGNGVSNSRRSTTARAFPSSRCPTIPPGCRVPRGVDRGRCGHAGLLEVPPITGRYYTAQLLDEWGEVIVDINDRTFPSKPCGSFALVTPRSKARTPRRCGADCAALAQGQVYATTAAMPVRNHWMGGAPAGNYATNYWFRTMVNDRFEHRTRSRTHAPRSRAHVDGLNEDGHLDDLVWLTIYKAFEYLRQQQPRWHMTFSVPATLAWC
jgi:hypothetical protein